VLTSSTESPRWLLKAGRKEEARIILGRLRSEDGNIDAPRAVAEYEDIVAAISLEQQHSKRNSYISMFFGRNDGDLHIARRVQLSIWLQIVQEQVFPCNISSKVYSCTSRWVGIAAITVYAPTIFAEAGYSARKSQWMSGLNDVSGTRARTLLNSPNRNNHDVYR
jgi:hypothetical protein